jgi:uncharacterized protein (TIGR00369 family)
VSSSPVGEQIRAMLRGEYLSPIGALLGFRLTAAENGRAVLEMDADERMFNPMGTLHGGILCDLADAAMGTAYVTTLADGESMTTLELKINYLRPFWSGRLVATASLVKGGRTIGLVECDVTDDQGRLVARSSSTLMTLRGEQAAGR